MPVNPQPPNAGATRLLRLGVAAVWLATGVLVVVPEYRAIGAAWIGRLGLDPALMWATCALEVALGLWVALRRPSGLDTALQVSLVVAFSAILAWLDPTLLVHPLGVLSKNLPFVACCLVAWRAQVEGFGPRTIALLRAGMAVVWITEGLFPSPQGSARAEGRPRGTGVSDRPTGAIDRRTAGRPGARGRRVLAPKWRGRARFASGGRGAAAPGPGRRQSSSASGPPAKRAVGSLEFGPSYPAIQRSPFGLAASPA